MKGLKVPDLRIGFFIPRSVFPPADMTTSLKHFENVWEWSGNVWQMFGEYLGNIWGIFGIILGIVMLIMVVNALLNQ